MIALKTFLIGILFLSFSNNFARNYKELFQKSVNSSLKMKKHNEKFTKALLSRNKEFNYLGSIKIGSRFAQSIPLRIYYQGSIIPFIDGHYQFPSTENIEKLTIIFATLNTPKKGNLSQLTIHLESPQTAYFLTRVKDLSKPNHYEWHIKKRAFSSFKRVPENALVFACDPGMINKLISPSWKKESSIIPLPVIYLQNTDQLQDESTRAFLAALDIDPFHKRLHRDVNKDHKPLLQITQES